MKKRELKNESLRKNVSEETNQKYVTILRKMIDCKTVFTRDFVNQPEYDRFYEILAQSFPQLTAKAKRMTFGSGCFVYVIEGKNAEKNIMLMSHHDVVDGDSNWDSDPFCS